MLLSFLLGCASLSSSDLTSQDPGMSGIPVPQRTELVEAAAVDLPPAPALTAVEVSGGLEISLDRLDSCPDFQHDVTAIRSGPVLTLRVEITEPLTAASASFRCAPDTSTRLELGVETNGAVMEVRYVDGGGRVAAVAEVQW